MKTITLTSLQKNQTEFYNNVEILTERYKCDWNDSVHDSYQLFVRQMQELVSSVTSIKTSAEEIKNEVESMHIDNLIEAAEDLCREADSI